MVAFLSVTCLLLLALTQLMGLSHRRRLRARREEILRLLAANRRIVAQCEAEREAERRRYEELSARQRASHAEALNCAEQRWDRLLAEIQGDFIATLRRVRLRQSTALARLQRGLPQPEVLRLHGTQRL
ncbi:hypothetical protein ACEZCY_21215 [Streptacidiphilus sp. N1-12]|uniref:Uncharacterized protein n=2 Tax=Streptacidiphilus alkalitolerans TaxID=3342712 RepID=A0ABV6X0V3_9ACTN